MNATLVVTQLNVHTRLTMRSTYLLPVTPYVSDSRWKTRHNQDIVIELSVECYLIPLEVGSRQNYERTLGDINIRDLYVKWVPLS